MSETFETWGLEFPECLLPDNAAALVEDFKSRSPKRYKERVETWRCPFLPEVLIVGLFKNGVVGGPSGPIVFAVTINEVLDMHDFIRPIAEHGSSGFHGSEETIPFYAALLLDYAPGDEDVTLIQPRDVAALNRDGIAAKHLIEVTRDGNVFDILAYVLDEESIVSRLKMKVSGSSGEVMGFDLETTNVESVARRGDM